MIITLAGHVDHGKTSLVKALTGVETDRLEEEKKRGLTIDLGFAYIDEGDIGFVDVPGHHKFIHNMVAGVASHQHALMVIAADDGPMPQSREHLEILRLIGVNEGTIALTKCDRVDDARIADCLGEIRNLVGASFLENAEVFQTSIENPVSTAQLLSHLRNQANPDHAVQNEKPFRLAIDRSFTVRGAGLVVTGTVHSGTVKLDQQLTHYPSGKKIRIRGIRAQDKEVTQSTPGDRCALNITGIDEVERGDWIIQQPSQGYKNLTIKLEANKDFPRAIKNWTPIHIYHATSHSTGRLATLHRLDPDTLIADILCDEPLACHQGDRIVIRDQSLDLTLGGGKVIYADNDNQSRRNDAKRLSKLKAHTDNGPEQCLDQLLNEGPTNLAEFADFWHLGDEQFQAISGEKNLHQAGDMAITETHWTKLKVSVVDFTSNAKSEQGLKENEFAQVPALFRQMLLNELVNEKALEYTGGVYKLQGAKIDLPAPLLNLWERLEKVLNAKQPPSTGDLSKSMHKPQQDLERSMNELVKRGLLVNIAGHRYYLPKQLIEIAEDIKLLVARNPETKAFTVREFRDHTGIGRNVAIDVLEYFDGKGFTRRQENQRIVLGTYP
ncbi:MAG: selenocysteine-specific translation elongation factor [Pseudomonadales bacterium]|jgi:selenocysteine-specific elongation factor|tara:strand:+ start:4114 stop:5943 length:1830 start_codon:yes stop_codon:yes gene_type:complete